ncbi:glutamate racemase [Edaphobacter bradus]|uniref:glutamate racemase n=1 Tax=Edaphobacter bradus TaxID=2259016 RepID=UPI0021E0CCD3|nr:glutamate racemase [Edaphobacter bradus]
MSSTPSPTPERPTIGVFDSGFGGLTVLRELLRLVPHARYIYLGDTARLPYGSKSHETVARYAVSSAHFLADQGADHLVIACNTATALALDDIRAALLIPVFGVIEPGAQAALSASHKSLFRSAPERTKQVDGGAEKHASPTTSHHAPPPKPAHALVLATSATTQSHAYTRALTALGLRATEKACPLLVPLVEEGWISHAVTAEVLRIYLLEALCEAPDASILLLGCTHYPLLRPLIENTLHELHHPMYVIDSAEATARAVSALLPPSASTEPPASTFYATDSIEKFQRLGSAFLGHPLNEVHLLDLGG